MSHQTAQLDNISSDPPISPIIDGYINTSNSEDISQGFISSTPLRLPKTSTLFDRKSFHQEAQLDISSNQPKSNIIHGYINPCSSKEITQGFISSTPLRLQPKSPTLFVRKTFRPTSVYQKDKQNDGNEQNTDVKTILTQILNKMKQFEVKLEQVESNVKHMQDEFTDFKNELRSMHLAENKLNRKTYCMCELIKRKVNKIISNETVEDELNFLMPADSVAALSDLEAKLANVTFGSKMVTLLKSKRSELGFDGLFRIIAKDNVYFEFNLDGRCKKRALLELKVFKEILYQATSGLTFKEYEKQLRKSILKAHNRFNKNNSLVKNKEKAATSTFST